MGTAVLDGQASSARSASQTLQSRQAHSVLSPVFRRSIAGSAPSTPSAAVQMEGCKRPKKAATEEDHDSLDGSSNEKELRQYDKWSAEEEHIFFLKLSTVSKLGLLDGFISIAQHLPKKNWDQVKAYFYRLKGQLQNHNPGRDVDELSQKEIFQAMGYIWSSWNKGGGQRSLSQRKLQSAAKRARYNEILQQSLERVFLAKEAREAQIAERKAEKAAQQKAAKQAQRLRLRQEALLAARLEAELEAEKLQLKRARQQKRRAAGVPKENSSLASNMQGFKLKGKARVPSSQPAIAKAACRKQAPMELELEGSGGTHRVRSPKGRKASRTAADSPALRHSDSQDSGAQLSCEAQDPMPASEAAELQDHADHTQEEQETQPLQDDADTAQHYPVDIEQHASMSQPQQECTAQATACEAGRQQSSAEAAACEANKQQSVTEGLRALNSMPAPRKEPLCLRVRPLDSPTRRLMQSLGCTALLEMPNNKPKKALEGLLRHLQKKWEKVTAQLGSGYELHLMGLLPGQQDACLSWNSQSSSFLTLGQVQQQVQQTGPFLELSYVWLPAANLHLPGHASAAAAQNKACISAQAAAGYALAKQRDPASRADAIERDHKAAESSDPAISPSTSVGPAIRSAVATSSSSSAQVVSEAFSNLQPAASLSLQTAARSSGQRSAAGENQAPALGCDVNSSVSGLVTPGKAQLSSLHEASIPKPEDTPSSRQLAAASAHPRLPWDSNDADFAFEPRLSQSHPDTMATQSQPQGALTTSQHSDRGTQYPQTGTPSQLRQSPPCHAPSEANPALDCSQSLEQVPDSAQDCLPQASGPVSAELTEQPSGFLSGEASVWSIQPPGALSAEPSGCWDDLPDAPLSLDNSLAADLGRHQQLQEHHQAEPSACMDDTRPQTHAEPDPFSMDDLDFDLPPLDSPDQPAVAAEDDNRGQAHTHAVLEALQASSGAAQQQHHAQELDAQAVTNVSGCQAAQTHAHALLEPMHSTSGDTQQQQHHRHEQDAQAGAQPVLEVDPQAVAREEDAMGQSVGASGDGASLAETYQACGNGSMTALLSSEADIPEASPPARGIPLKGTIVVGVPCKTAAPAKRRKKNVTLSSEAKQPRKLAKAAVLGERHQQQQEQAGAGPSTQPAHQGQPAAAPAAGKPKARKQRKRKEIVVESPPRLPPISPGALSLQAGVKRRRLAKQLEEQAKADVASASQPEQAQSGLCSEQHDQMASQAATHAVGRDVANASEHCTQDSAENSTQPQPQHDARPPASQAAAAAASAEGDKSGGEGENQEDQGLLSCPVSSARHDSAADSAQPAVGRAGAHKGDDEGTTLSFDVGAMELFQQQDTCDAFGSFWRRTSGVGASGSQGAGPSPRAAPSAFGVGDLSLGCWKDSHQAKQASTSGAAGASPADDADQPQRPDGRVPDEAQQASPAGGCGDMDLTNYFATLPNEVVAFKDLVAPSPSMIPSLESPAQQAPQLPCGSDPVQCCGEYEDVHALASDHEQGTMGGSPGVRGLPSRLPTQQEIQHMDELDLSINLGSLLGPGDIWMVEEDDQIGLSHAATAGNAACKPFQELFP